MGCPPFLGQADNKPHSWSQPRNSAEKLIRSLAGRARKATGTRWKLWKFFDFGNANNQSSRNCLGLDIALSTQPLHPAFERPAVEAGPFFYFAIGYRRTVPPSTQPASHLLALKPSFLTLMPVTSSSDADA